MAISQYNVKEIMEDDRISPAARQLLFAVFDHQPDSETLDARWAELRDLLAELQSAGYVMRGDGWKSQAGGHYMLFDRWQAPTVAGRLPPVPPKTFGREVLYVIGQPGTSIVKIGRTTSVTTRLRSIQTGSPVPLSLLWWHPGGRELERYLHRRFKRLRLHGEWFDFGVEEPDVLVESAVEERHPDEFPPPMHSGGGFRDHLRWYPPGCRYDFLLNGLPPGPVRFPRHPEDSQ